MQKTQPNPLREIGTYEWLIRLLAAVTTFLFGYSYVATLYASILGPAPAAWLAGLVDTFVTDIGSLLWYKKRIDGSAQTERQLELAKDASDALFWLSVAKSIAVLILAVDLVTWPGWLLQLAGIVGTVGTIGAVVLNFWTVDQYAKAGPANKAALADAQDRAALRDELRGRISARRAERLDTLADQLFQLGYDESERGLIDEIAGTGTAERLRQPERPTLPAVTPTHDDLWQSILSDDMRQSERQRGPAGSDAGASFRNGTGR
ncbi:MAG: hypothetical protein KDE34_02565 [Anaerolineales bacterium]|nr:hypothetical protein [Anaerolineales bacterium]